MIFILDLFRRRLTKVKHRENHAVDVIVQAAFRGVADQVIRRPLGGALQSMVEDAMSSTFSWTVNCLHAGCNRRGFWLSVFSSARKEMHSQTPHGHGWRQDEGESCVRQPAGTRRRHSLAKTRRAIRNWSIVNDGGGRLLRNSLWMTEVMCIVRAITASRSSLAEGLTAPTRSTYALLVVELRWHAGEGRP